MELRHRASLVGLKVLQIKAPHEEILAPDVFRDQMHLGGGESGRGCVCAETGVGWGPSSAERGATLRRGVGTAGARGGRGMLESSPAYLPNFNVGYTKDHLVVFLFFVCFL